MLLYDRTKRGYEMLDVDVLVNKICAFGYTNDKLNSETYSQFTQILLEKSTLSPRSGSKEWVTT